MGGCFSKKKGKEEDPSSSPRARGGGGRKGQKTVVVGSRDPPPTESPQEEMVKEVLSETPKITRQKSNKNKKKIDLDRGKRDATVDRSQLSEEFSAASTTLTETTATTITRGVGEAAAEDDEEGREGEIEMMKKVRPAVTRSRSSANFQKKINRSDFNVKDVHRPAAAGKREIRGVDVGCRSARSSPSPATARAREKGNAVTRNRVSSSSSADVAAAGGGHRNNNNNNYSNYYKRSDAGERSGRRSLSPVKKGSVVSAAPAMNQRQCRANTNLSATASTATKRANINGRFSPQRASPAAARILHLEEGRRGQDCNNVGSAGGGGEDGNGLEAKEEESLENPLVSMECFIFL